MMLLITLKSILVAVVLAATMASACQCDAGDYWCSSDDMLRQNFNCSGSAEGRALWENITKSEDDPSPAVCDTVAHTCLPQPLPARNATCDSDCYSFCW